MEKNRSKIILVYTLLVISYFFSYFFRISTSVVLPVLGSNWGLSASIVGFISSMYYYTYAIMQPMCGALNDRICPEKIVGFGIIITSIGSLCFGIGNNIAWLVLGRLLMGIGLSPMLSGLLVFQGNNFRPEQYTFLSGLSMMIGNFGAVVSVAPLSLALNKWGRTKIFCILSFLTVFIAIGLFLSKTKAPNKIINNSFSKTLKKQLKDSFHIVKSSENLKRIIIIWMIIFGSLMAYQGLWAVSWFKITYPEKLNLASLAATFIGIGVMIGNFLGIYLSKKSKQRYKIIANLVYSIFAFWIITVFCFFIKAPLLITIISSTILGIMNGMAFTQLTAGINDIASKGKGGTLFGITNCITFTCVIIFQWGTGALIDLFSKSITPQRSYILTFVIVICILIVTCISARGLKPFKKIE